MLRADDFHDWLTRQGCEFFTGVPDSLLKDFCACVAERGDATTHLIAANEGAAVALAAGQHLATGRTPVVYMQNSGLGNAVNPLTSLADPEVYSIPMLLLIGWRGQPGKPDEPQHIKQGRISQAMLDCLEIPSAVLSDQPADAEALVARAVNHAQDTQSPFAILVPAGCFAPYAVAGKSDINTGLMSREAAIREVASALQAADIIVSTTGKASRELFEFRQQSNPQHAGDFLTVGSMGHASQIAQGIAMRQPGRRVVCLDGDGAAIMHMGSMAIVGCHAPPNYRHIILNNGAHDSVGGQPTVGGQIRFCEIAQACGYRDVRQVDQVSAIKTAISELDEKPGPTLLEIRVAIGARADLGRPTLTPRENKQRFMDNLGE